MRRPLFVLVAAALVLPSALSARQPDPDPKSTAPDAAPAAEAQAAPAVAGHNGRQSLVGMVMAALIYSAEQQSTARKAATRQESGKAKPASVQTGPPAQADVSADQVAVQPEP